MRAGGTTQRRLQERLGHRIPGGSSSISALYAPRPPDVSSDAVAIDDVMAQVQAWCKRAVLIAPQQIEKEMEG
jgi:hypothetical protein